MKRPFGLLNTIRWWMSCLSVALVQISTASQFSFADYSSPDFFPILTWDPLHGWTGKSLECETNGLESIAACGFNCAGFVLPSDLPRCRKLGLAAILLPSGAGVIPLNYQQEWRKLSDAKVERRVKAMIRSGGSSPALKGYFIMDEPAARDFPALGKAVAAVKKYAPGKLAYINLFPNYATLGAPDTSQLGTSNYTEYLERFVSEVHPQIISYDNYQVQYSNDLKDRGLAASYFRNLLEVRRIGLKHHLPCLQIVASNQLRPGHTIPSPQNLLFQAYTTLAAGFRGVTWYTYYARGYFYSAIGPDGNKTVTWPYLREVNRQVASLAPFLSRLVSTGVFFSGPVPADDMPTLPGKVVQELTCATPMMLGEFSGGHGETYAMLVNLSLEHSANFQMKAADELKQVSPADGTLAVFKAGNDGFWLPAGQGILLKCGHAADAINEPGRGKNH